METINIFGENRFETSTKTRKACRGIVISNGMILLTYEVNTNAAHREDSMKNEYREVSLFLSHKKANGKGLIVVFNFGQFLISHTFLR